MAEWWSIEVFHGEFRARQWQDAYSSMLIESAVTAGASGWEWHEHRWGVVFEVEFGEDSRWETFRALPAVQAALDAVPDPVNWRASTCDEGSVGIALAKMTIRVANRFKRVASSFAFDDTDRGRAEIAPA
jgi:hypothetical protein